MLNMKRFWALMAPVSLALVTFGLAMATLFIGRVFDIVAFSLNIVVVAFCCLICAFTFATPFAKGLRWTVFALAILTAAISIVVGALKAIAYSYYYGGEGTLAPLVVSWVMTVFALLTIIAYGCTSFSYQEPVECGTMPSKGDSLSGYY